MSGYWDHVVLEGERLPIVAKIFLALLAVFILASLYVWISGAVELSISGHSLGSGWQSMSFAGDLLNVSILQMGDTLTWQVVGSGLL